MAKLMIGAVVRVGDRSAEGIREAKKLVLERLNENILTMDEEYDVFIVKENGTETTVGIKIAVPNVDLDEDDEVLQQTRKNIERNLR